MHPQETLPTDRTAPTLKYGSRTQDAVKVSQYLSQGVPFVVENVKVEGVYNPKYFINKYHGTECNITLVESGITQPSTVDRFFESFSHPHEPAARAKLKVKYRSSDCLVHLMISCFR